MATAEEYELVLDGPSELCDSPVVQSSEKTHL